jgi:ATP-binding cassette subfamily C (CFTR/MRP) protein 1
VLLDDIFSGLDPMTEEVIFQGLFGANGILRNTLQTVILATHAIHLLAASDMIILLGENSDVVYQGPQATFPKDLISRRNLLELADTEYPDLAAVSRRIESAEQIDFNPTFYQPARLLDASASNVARQTGDSTVWNYYFKTASYKHSLFFVFLGALCMGFTPAQTLWLNAWANDRDNGKIGYYLGIYTVFFVGEIALTSVWIWHVLIYPLSASSIKLHDIQLDALMSATMSFFSNTDTGKLGAHVLN